MDQLMVIVINVDELVPNMLNLHLVVSLLLPYGQVQLFSIVCNDTMNHHISIDVHNPLRHCVYMLNKKKEILYFTQENLKLK